MNPLSRQHLKNLRQLQLKKVREETQRFLIEGMRLCEEAAAAGASIEEAVIDPQALRGARAQRLLARLSSQGVPLWTTDAIALQALADTQSPQGIVAIVRKQPATDFELTSSAASLLLALEGISDPGNLGTILRSAAWFGVNTVLLSQNATESTNPKVLRSTMGAFFHLDIHEQMDFSALIAAAARAGYRLIAAVAQDGTPAQQWRPGKRDILFIGSEARGLPAEWMEQMSLRLTISRHGGGESLNAAIAASIMMYQWSVGQ